MHAGYPAQAGLEGDEEGHFFSSNFDSGIVGRQ
jgi:hypothetical protein